MRNNGDIKSLEIVLQTETAQPDSDVETLLETTLGDSIEPFFWDCKVDVLSFEENRTRRSDTKLSHVFKAPIKTFEYTLTKEEEEHKIKVLIYKSSNIKCLRCQKIS